MMKWKKYCYPYMSLTWRTHKSEETGAPRKMHLRIRLRAHVSAYQRRQIQGTFTWGSADPQVWPNLDKRMSRCSSMWSSPYSSLSRGDNVSILEEDKGGNIPRISTPPRHLHHYIKGLSPPPSHSFIHSHSFHHPTHTISYMKEKSREAPPLCIISLGSV